MHASTCHCADATAAVRAPAWPDKGAHAVRAPVQPPAGDPLADNRGGSDPGTATDSDDVASDQGFEEGYSEALNQQLQGSSMASTFQSAPQEQPDPDDKVITSPNRRVTCLCMSRLQIKLICLSECVLSRSWQARRSNISVCCQSRSAYLQHNQTCA